VTTGYHCLFFIFFFQKCQLLWGYNERCQIFDGKPFWSDEERLNMLALLLENIGIDEAIKLADLELWQEAINDSKRN